MRVIDSFWHRVLSHAARAAGLVLLAATIGISSATAAVQINTPSSRPGPDQTHIPEPEPQPTPPIITGKQKQELLKSNFAAMKKHADQLQKMANSLQKMIDDSNENVLSLDVIKKADAIQKLAKKIKSEAKGI